MIIKEESGYFNINSRHVAVAAEDTSSDLSMLNI